MGRKMTDKEWDNLIVIGLLNQFFWIVVAELMFGEIGYD